MKNIYTKLCLSAIGCLMMASCDFLDVVPQGTATVDDIYRTQYQAEGMVLSCYANIPNYFHPQQFPDFTGGNEIITSKGGTTRWFHFRSLVYGEESPTTTYYSLWSNTAKSYPQGAVKKAVWESIRNCYNVLNNLDRVSDITPENLSWWKGEALFLIGYYHQIMLEYYGPIVIIDKEIPMESSPAEMMTSRSPYDTCVDFIANKYSEAARLLPGVWDSSKRNRATSSAALAFKARLLLYAASPLVNGNSEFYSDFKNPDGTFLINQTYDREKWKRAMDAAKEAIDLCEENGYKLYGNSTNDLEQGKKNYHEAFVGDGISGSGFNWNEVLFGFAEQGTISYCIKNMAPRVEFTSYSTKGFRGSLFPTWYFMGSDFTYDDMGSRNVDEDTHTLLGEETVDGQKCWKLESLPKDKRDIYSRKTALIRQDCLIPVRVEYYDKMGKLHRRLEMSDIAKVEGFWVARKMHMTNVQTEHQTVLEIKNPTYNIPMEESKFNVTTLEKGRF